MIQVLLAVAVGVSLAACCGLRAFLPLLAAGALGRLGWSPLHASFEWLGSTPALVALSAACAVELLADKVPALDHALDVAATPLRTVAGAIAAASAVAPFPTWAALLLGVAASGVALSVHTTKATTRGASTLTTGGVANPALSIAEDIACVAGSVLALLLWFVAVALALAALGFVALAVRFVVQRARKAPPVVP